MAVYEGDMVLYKVGSPQDPDSGISNDASVISDNGDYCWPGGILYYEMPANHPRRDDILQAINTLNNETNLTIKPKSANVEDYIFIKSDKGCWAGVGKYGGRQELNIGQHCSIGSIIHEFIHAAGFMHEQARPDRDQYVQILFDNIKEGKEHNFETVDIVTSASSYDFGSIMHYSETAFSVKRDLNNNFLPTIRPKQPLPPGVIMGQRDGLSQKDVIGINARYGGPDSNCGGPLCKNLQSKQMNDGKVWLTQNLDCELPNSYCYENNPENCKNYGRLYTFEAAKEGCAQLGEGWRLPTIEEWETLANQYGGLSTDENKQAGNAAYQALIAGGAAGFNALPGGAWLDRHDGQERKFLRLDMHGMYWSSTEGSDISGIQDPAFYTHFIKDSSKAYRFSEEKKQAYSVRCIKD